MKSIRLLQVDLAELDPGPPDSPGHPYAAAFLRQVTALQAEAKSLAALPVPGAFTGNIPDTPEAKAARFQLLLIRYGFEKAMKMCEEG